MVVMHAGTFERVNEHDMADWTCRIQERQSSKDEAAAAATGSKPHSKRRKVRSLFRRWKVMSFRHTWVNPLVLILIILSAYAYNPTTDNPLHRALFLSYPLPRPADADPDTPIQYGKGKRDLAFVAFYMLVLSFTREFLIQRVIRPLAVYCGITRRAKQARFMEQTYSLIYFGIFGPFGLYVMSRTPVWYFNTTGMFETYPHKTHDAVFKTYYLLQASYWGQQALVLLLQLEKPRKDYKELVGHHIITLSLIALSYRFHFTYMGLAVYITHDISDFFLASSKTLNYLDSFIVAPYFATFVVVWIYLRHYVNLRILWALLTEYRTVGPYELNWETEQYKSPLAQVITFSLLASLQAVNLFWLFLILRIAKNFAFSHVAKDERSDDEDDEGETGVDEFGDKVERRGHAGPELLVNGVSIDGTGAGAAERTVNAKVNGNGNAKVGNGYANGAAKSEPKKDL
ncbi:MAG: hypothetical protein M1819_000421 [Sarea resinae]|nr:MAG: hypothetical protein M1819_000421 [Sarea resinae]